MSARAWRVFALSLLASRPAFASDSYAYRLAFAAPEGCPGVAEMMHLVEARSARARAADPVEPAVELGAKVVEEAGGYVGLLRVRTLDGTETTRAVPATTCSEAVSAMALIAAIVVDPDAAAFATSAPPETDVAEPQPKPPAPEIATDRPSPAELPAPDAPAVDRAPAARASSSREPFWWTVDAEAGIAGAVSPLLAPDFALGVGWVDTRRRLVAPSFHLTARWATSSDVSVGDVGTAHFWRIGGRLSGCPVRVGLENLSLRPCAFLELGSLGGDGSRTVDPAHPTVFWGAAGAALRGDATLLGRFVVGLDLGALFPFGRDEFYFDPNHARAYRVEAVGFVGSVGVGVRFL